MKTILVTFMLEISPAELAKITGTDESRRDFDNTLMRINGVQSVTYHHFTGPYVWVSVNSRDREPISVLGMAMHTMQRWLDENALVLT